MRRQAVSSWLRIVIHELGVERSLGGNAYLSRALSSVSVAPSSSHLVVGAQVGAVNQGFAVGASAPVRGLTPGSRRHLSEEAAWNTIIYPDLELEVGSPAPDFALPAVVDGDIKDIKLSDYKGKYVILFWYPKDFTFVCPTEIIAFSDRVAEFEKLNCQLIAASTDTPEVHLAWVKTPRKRGGLGFMRIPILADVTKEVAARYGVLKRDVGIALRGLYIINPEGVVEHATVNNFPVGRNVDEALRTLQAIQYVAEHGEVCPAGWKPGDKAMVADPEKSLDYFESAEASQMDGIGGKTTLRVVNDANEFHRMISGGGKVAVKFWAPWCGKCKQIAPFTEELAQKHADIAVFASVDTTDDKLEGLTSDLGVKGLPAFRFYKDGKELNDLRVMGYKKQPLEESMNKLVGM